jgi:hypothetical protein
LIIKQKAQIEASQSNLEEIKKKGLANLDDDSLYEELLTLYSEYVLQVEEAIKLCNSEREDPKKVVINIFRKRNIPKESFKF